MDAGVSPTLDQLVPAPPLPPLPTTAANGDLISNLGTIIAQISNAIPQAQQGLQNLSQTLTGPTNQTIQTTGAQVNQGLSLVFLGLLILGIILVMK